VRSLAWSEEGGAVKRKTASDQREKIEETDEGTDLLSRRLYPKVTTTAANTSIKQEPNRREIVKRRLAA
jgi:hypothetical protein